MKKRKETNTYANTHRHRHTETAVREQTRPDTRLPQSHAGGQLAGTIFENTISFGQEQ